MDSSESRSRSVSPTPSVLRARRNIAESPTQPCSDEMGALALLQYSLAAWVQEPSNDKETRAYDGREWKAALGLTGLGRNDAVDREQTVSCSPELNAGIEGSERTQSCSPERNSGFAALAPAHTALERPKQHASVGSIQVPQKVSRPAAEPSQEYWEGLLGGSRYQSLLSTRSSTGILRPASIRCVPGAQHITRPVVQRACWNELEAMKKDVVYPSHSQCLDRDLPKAHLEYLATMYLSLKPGYVLQYPKPDKKKIFRPEPKMDYSKCYPKPASARKPANHSTPTELPVLVRKTKSPKKSTTTAGCTTRPTVGTVENGQGNESALVSAQGAAQIESGWTIHKEVQQNPLPETRQANEVSIVNARGTVQNESRQTTQEEVQQNPLLENKQSPRPTKRQLIIGLRFERTRSELLHASTPVAQGNLQWNGPHSSERPNLEKVIDGEQRAISAASEALPSEAPKPDEPVAKPESTSPRPPNAELPQSSPSGSENSRGGRTRKRTQRAIEGEENAKELVRVLKRARK